MSAPDRGRLLLHACCATCLIAPVRRFREEGWRVAASFYNPNVHPLIEFRRRLKAMKVLQESLPVDVFYEERYGLREWLEQVDWRGCDRCSTCYEMRLAHTAGLARHEGFDAFTTTLLSSGHQDHAAVRRAGERAAAQTGVPFLYRDLRPDHEEGHRLARQKGLYLQSYCGCIFSEYDRYRSTSLHLYKGPSGGGHT